MSELTPRNNTPDNNTPSLQNFPRRSCNIIPQHHLVLLESMSPEPFVRFGTKTTHITLKTKGCGLDVLRMNILLRFLRCGRSAEEEEYVHSPLEAWCAHWVRRAWRFLWSNVAEGTQHR